MIVDEIPQVDRAYKLKIPFNQSFITEHVEIAQAVNERVARLNADVPSTLTPELSEMQAKFTAMPRGQNDGFFKFACKTAVHFKGDQAKITKALHEAAGADRKLQAKIKPALNSLRKYGLI